MRKKLLCIVKFCLSSAFEFLSTCKLANLTVKAELGCCLLHRSGRLTIDSCVLQCESNPLDHLSCPIVSTASAQVFSSSVKCHSDGVSVSRTRIEGGAKAVLTSGDLALQRVRVIYARTSLFFWFDVEHQWFIVFLCKASVTLCTSSEILWIKVLYLSFSFYQFVAKYSF